MCKTSMNHMNLKGIARLAKNVTEFKDRDKPCVLLQI